LQAPVDDDRRRTVPKQLSAGLFLDRASFALKSRPSGLDGNSRKVRKPLDVESETGFTPNVREEIDSPDLILRLVAAGLGISLVPLSACKTPRPGVALRMLEASRRVLDTAVAWPKHAALPVLELFLEVVREVFSPATGLPRRRNP
jgi:DNA-binding transcriptional LysR family regulator